MKQEPDHHSGRDLDGAFRLGPCHWRIVLFAKHSSDARTPGDPVVCVQVRRGAIEARLRSVGHKDGARYLPWRLEGAFGHPGGQAFHPRGCFRRRLLRGRRRGSLQQNGERLPRQRLRIDQRDQDHRQEDGSVQCESGQHPAAAACMNSACRVERGVFKHGQPPRELQPRRTGGGKPIAQRGRAALRDDQVAESGGPVSRCFGNPFIPIGTTVLV